MPAGRPPKYDPEFHPATVLELLGQGLGMTQLSARIKVATSTIYEWIKTHKEFSEAVREGLTYSEAWWLDQAQNNLTAKHFQTGLWALNMKNRFGWQDKIHTYITENENPKDKTDEQLKEENAT